MAWAVVIAKSAEKKLRKIPSKDQHYILKALEDMEQNPFSGDVVRLKNQDGVLRRRVGHWRIFFEIDFDNRRVLISAIERRTSTTY